VCVCARVCVRIQILLLTYVHCVLAILYVKSCAGDNSQHGKLNC